MKARPATAKTATIVCDDGAACTADTIIGSAETCNVACSYTEIEVCVSDDGCCPAGCNVVSDSDCSASCGDGVVSDDETCDPGLEDSCPETCDDNNACTNDSLSGAAESCSLACSYTEVLECISDDGCCAPGCNSLNDNDCSPECGNGVVEAGEACDGDCPSTCSSDNACESVTLTGAADTCDAVCVAEAILACVDNDGCCGLGQNDSGDALCSLANDNDCSATCGDGVVSDGEACDSALDDSCPVACDDSNVCTTDSLVGSADNCTASCQFDPVEVCQNDDGCCAPGCNANDDNDCAPVCGNDVVEAGESCDGNCLSTCFDGDFCTDDIRTGSADSCDVACTFTDVTVLCRRGMAAAHPGAHLRMMKIVQVSVATASLKRAKNVMTAIRSTPATAVHLNVERTRSVVMVSSRAFSRLAMMVMQMLVVAVMPIALGRARRQAVGMAFLS